MERIDKLTDVKPYQAIFLSDNDLTNYVFETKRVELEIGKNYNVALVLGCSIRDIMKCRADDAIALYKTGAVEKLVLTGGVGFLSLNRSDSEANVMKRYMLENGVSEKDILIEDKSRDTYENMKNSDATIKKVAGENGKIVLITSDFHKKRAKLLFKSLSRLEVVSYGVLDNVHDIDKWSESGKASRRLLKLEGFALSRYANKGIITDEPVVEIDKSRR